jgi:hypothetical protein
MALIETTLDGVMQEGDAYLDADQGAEALAAAEVVARLQGNWGVQSAYTERLDLWVGERTAVPVPDLAWKALRAIDRVLRPPSELLELWEEAGADYEEWRATLQDLRSRLRC